MKKLAFLAAAVLACTSMSFARTTLPLPEEVNERVLKAFEATFTGVTDLKWKEYEEFYSASFRQQGILSEVRYNKRGKFLSSLRYYGENMLPLCVLNEVKKMFPSKSIFGVTEFTEESSVIYYIKLEDAKSWITLKADLNGNTQVIEKFRKS